jgi:hypothetical protein
MELKNNNDIVIYFCTMRKESKYYIDHNTPKIVITDFFPLQHVNNKLSFKFDKKNRDELIKFIENKFSISEEDDYDYILQHGNYFYAGYLFCVLYTFMFEFQYISKFQKELIYFEK